ncbi:uncharacterized protein Ecym_2234 [Eremothecium cymbalariae DBVPG|uniref:Uncharacterized protein n=1 Tax=Eremothecium cymbalariae (strain CBS 270.75 / DBVPG 7215 / KCTC 17166 / NRRL Y-17582) TaxID=931890 RepID=G8JP76_ERECY|nr:Hypothetical protein Ecym_2234 [Eremothecium cymbalariae DBVPG\
MNIKTENSKCFYVKIFEHGEVFKTLGVYTEESDLLIDTRNKLIGVDGRETKWDLDSKPFLDFIHERYESPDVIYRDWLVIERCGRWVLEETDYTDAHHPSKMLTELREYDLPQIGSYDLPHLPSDHAWTLRCVIADLARMWRLSEDKCALLKEELSKTKKASIALINSKKAKIRQLSAAIESKGYSPSPSPPSADLPDSSIMHKFASTDTSSSAPRIEASPHPSPKLLKSNFETPRIPQPDDFEFRGINKSISPLKYQLDLSATTTPTTHPDLASPHAPTSPPPPQTPTNNTSLQPAVSIHPKIIHTSSTTHLTKPTSHSLAPYHPPDAVTDPVTESETASDTETE